MYDQNGSKDSHTSVLIDLVGSSTSTNISGFLIHMVANTKDGNIPHTTDFNFQFWVTQVDQSNSWIQSDPIGILWKSDRVTWDYVGSWQRISIGLRSIGSDNLIRQVKKTII